MVRFKIFSYLRLFDLNLYLYILCFFLTSTWQTQAAPVFYIPVGTAQVKKAVLAFPEIQTSNPSLKPIAKTVFETVTRDLIFMDLLQILKPSAFVEDTKVAGITPGTFKFQDWTQVGAELILKSSISVEPNQVLSFETHLYDAVSTKQILGRKYLAPMKEMKNLAHTFANDVIQTLTGLPGIFLTKIAMTCDRTGKKEIYIMNFDGSEVKQVTHHRSIAFAPAWSPDSTRIAYSLYTKHPNNIKNIDLYEFNFITHSIRLLSDRRGINSGAAYSPDGSSLALTLSFKGNPEIFVMDLKKRSIQQLTRSLSFDVDPAWSPDGKNLAFVSSRTGSPMIYTMKRDQKEAQRLTYAGVYNATPSWSSQNNKIAFAGVVDKIFDIFIMNPDGTHIERLTKGQGNNEDPHFSPDGNFITFSSNRTGQKNIYVMNTDGTYIKRLTYGLGNCVAPKWSNPPVPQASNPQTPSQ